MAHFLKLVLTLNLVLALIPTHLFAQQENLRGQVVSIDASNAVNICSGTGDIRIATACTGGGTQSTWVFDESTGVLDIGSGPLGYSSDANIYATTADGSDNLSLSLHGGGLGGISRGAQVLISGNEDSSGGDLLLKTGNSATSEMTLVSRGGIFLQDTSGNNKLEIDFDTDDVEIKGFSSDGSDDKRLGICSARSCADTRGGYIQLSGNEESSNAGDVQITAGNVAGGQIGFITGSSGAATSIYFSPYGISTAAYFDNKGNLVFNSAGDYGITQSFGSLTATGSTQGDAATVVDRVSDVLGADGTKGVKLPSDASTGDQYFLQNRSAGADIKLYPHSGAAINNGSANASVTLTRDDAAMCTLFSSTAWSCHLMDEA